MNLYTSHLQRVLQGQQKVTNISNYVKDLNVYDARQINLLDKSKDKALILAEKMNNVKLQKEIDHYEGVVSAIYQHSINLDRRLGKIIQWQQKEDIRKQREFDVNWSKFLSKKQIEKAKMELPKASSQKVLKPADFLPYLEKK